MESNLEVAFLPSPGMGHLFSMVELAKKLDTRRFSTTILTFPHLGPDYASAFKSYVDTIGADISFVELPQADTSPPCHETNQRAETFLTRLVESYRSSVEGALSGRPVVALILDLFCTSMIDVATELDIKPKHTDNYYAISGWSFPSYIYFTSNAAFLGSMLYLPTFHSESSTSPEVEVDVRFIPTLPPLPPHYMPPGLRNKNDESRKLFVEHGRRFRHAKGFIVNTFAELETRALRAIASGECLPDCPMLTPPVFTVGPVLSRKEPTDGHGCIEWLDRQPVRSTVFLCFGSMGSFDGSQVREIAIGLESSGFRFLWALRSPSSDRGWTSTDADLDKVLPLGFLERTAGRGMVWPSWVPQMEILGHPAVGGFVTHCGWNSTLESLWFGVPMLGWPLYAEQHLNCLQMVEDLGVAVELGMDDGNGGFVSSDELERAVRCLMEDCKEGNRVRTRVKEMKVASRRAVEDDGSSCVALEQFMKELMSIGALRRAPVITDMTSLWARALL